MTVGYAFAGGMAIEGPSSAGWPTSPPPLGNSVGALIKGLLYAHVGWLFEPEQAARAFLDYVEQRSDGFIILVKGSGLGSSTSTLMTLLHEVAERVAEMLGRGLAARGFDESLAPIYAHILVGLVAFTGQWWLEVRTPDRDDVVAHVVRVAWDGLSQLDPNHTRYLHIEIVDDTLA